VSTLPALERMSNPPPAQPTKHADDTDIPQFYTSRPKLDVPAAETDGRPLPVKYMCVAETLLAAIDVAAVLMCV
jgi:hypothetical protein